MRRTVIAAALAAAAMNFAGEGSTPGTAGKPNILFAIADDWGFPHASCLGDPVVKTPAFDRVAREGVLFRNAYVSAPSCTPCRGSILTGQWFWRLEGAANLWSVFPDKFTTYPEILERAGYVTGYMVKGWGPGKTETPGRNPCGPRYKNFKEFLEKRPRGKPFCFWLGSKDPHRPYDPGSGARSGMDLDKIRLFPCFPDNRLVRSDVADYYFEVQRFDRLVGSALKALEEEGILENTFVVVTGDHNMPFPRCKANLYDTGTRVPLAVRYPKAIPAGRVVEDFVCLPDFAPTFLALAGIKPPASMTARSLLPLLFSNASGWVDPKRNFIVFGRERHCPAQEKPDMGGYPSRALRTRDFLYIRNFRPDRWPAGTPDYRKAAFPGMWYGDCDNGPTKTYMIENRDKDDYHRWLYELAFAKRPAEELYDLRTDPDQLINVAGAPGYEETKKKLSEKLMTYLKETGDPRALGKGDMFDRFPYLGGGPKYPGLKKKRAGKK